VTTAQDIIKGALRRCNAYQSGDALASQDANDALTTLNELLDSMSTDNEMVFGSTEYVLNWIAGTNQYRIGNPSCTDLGESPFVGTLTFGSPTISAITSIPTDLAIGATLTGLSNAIPADTTVLAIGATTVTMSGNATASASLDQVTYTIPGDFAVARPLRITAGFTRINQLDFPFDVYTTQEEYTSILYKGQPGPWPTVAWYNDAMPYGILSVYQTPSSSAEVHLFTDNILSNLTLNQTLIMPQGYVRALKWLLAQELCAEFGYPLTESIKTNAKSSSELIKALNAKPAKRSTYDRALVSGDRPDGGWITHGGYR
jgi:hypothetical protein